MESRVFLKLYFLHAIPMMLALGAAVLLARQFQFEPALPVVVLGIVFGGLVRAVQNSYQAGMRDAQK